MLGLKLKNGLLMEIISEILRLSHIWLSLRRLSHIWLILTIGVKLEPSTYWICILPYLDI
jgi:hypothetical protein